MLQSVGKESRIGRKRGQLKVYTDTPERDNLEEIKREKERKKIRRSKRDLFCEQKIK